MAGGRARSANRYVLVAASAMALLAAMTLLAERYGPPVRGLDGLPALSIHSSRDHGARALSLWLSDLGYRPVSLEYRPFVLDPGTAALFVLTPDENLTEDHAERIARWVEAGGTVITVAEEPNPLFGRLGLEVRTGGNPVVEAVPSQPLFPNLPIDRVEVETTSTLRLLQPQWVPMLGAAESGTETVAAVAAMGRGRAFALAATRPLSNAGLTRADNWKLALYFVAGVPRGGSIAFDEYHHGLTEHGTLRARLLGEPWGWALLYATGLVFVYVALRGRRFGRAVPAFQAGPKRSRAEYVATLAALLRRGKHRAWLCRQFAGQVRRAVGSHYRVPADLPAAEFGAAVAALRPEAAALAGLLARLEEEPPRDEAILVRLVREVDTLRDRLLRAVG